MRACADRLRHDGRLRTGVFVDADFPEEFGWTAIAFEPITREEGRRYFGDLKLA
jgi:hypothetical protein